MAEQATLSQVAFDPNHVRVPSMTRQKGYVDYLLTAKAKLLLCYDDLFDMLFSYGISPPDAAILFEEATKDDMLTFWRVKHAFVKTVNHISKVEHNDTGSTILDNFDQTILDIFMMLVEDFKQIGREFHQKLGNSKFNDSLLKRLKEHKKLMDAFKEHLKSLYSHFKLQEAEHPPEAP